MSFLDYETSPDDFAADWAVLDVSDVRNCIRVVYGKPVLTRIEREPETLMEKVRAWFGRRPYEMRMVRPCVELRDEASIVRYGKRFMEIVETEDCTEEMAHSLASRVMRDLHFTL